MCSSVYRSAHGPIGGRDVSSVGDMVVAFDGDIPKRDATKVTDMDAMFFGAAAIHGDVSKWDATKVTDMDTMFFGAAVLHGDVSAAS